MMSMKRMKPMAALTGVLLLSSVAAQAAEPTFATGGYARGGKGMRTMEMMKTMDKDGDHIVTKDEFMAYHEKMFAMMDSKKKGMLDKDDWLSEQRMASDGSVSFGTGGYARGGEGMRTMKMMKAMDKDADHKVTKQEFMAYHDKIFAMMDKNKDGKLSADEWLEKQRKATDG
jgi:Ca2+-binding EF-hand superfamily protein